MDVHHLFPFYYHRDTSYESVIDAQVNKLGNILFEYLLIFSLIDAIFMFQWQCGYCHIVMPRQPLLFTRLSSDVSYVVICFTLSEEQRMICHISEQSTCCVNDEKKLMKSRLISPNTITGQVMWKIMM